MRRVNKKKSFKWAARSSGDMATEHNYHKLEINQIVIFWHVLTGNKVFWWTCVSWGDKLAKSVSKQSKHIGVSGF